MEAQETDRGMPHSTSIDLAIVARVFVLSMLVATMQLDT
jgi:hypothetical protein